MKLHVSKRPVAHRSIQVATKIFNLAISFILPKLAKKFTANIFRRRRGEHKTHEVVAQRTKVFFEQKSTAFFGVRGKGFMDIPLIVYQELFGFSVRFVYSHHGAGRFSVYGVSFFHAFSTLFSFVTH